MLIEDTEENRDLILGVAKKLWPRTVKLEIIQSGPGARLSPMYKVITKSDNCIARAFLDPDNFLTWLQPTGSTELEDC